MTEWASKGAAGDPPAQNMVQCRELGERLGGAQAAAAAAKDGAAGIQDELVSVHTELQGIGDRIEATALEIMAGENTNVSAELEAAARAFAAIAAKCIAPRRAIAEHGRDIIASGRPDAGKVWLRHAEAMGGTNLPDPLPLVSDVDAAAQEWLQHIGRLIDG